jgi:uncharacterized protein YggU (UPF0235/DUF167 family)
MTKLTLKIQVKPNARASTLEPRPDGTWIARLKSPPVDGKANDELTALVAHHFRCRRAAVRIQAGTSGRTKLLRVDLE